jgi:hypothetical protein
MNVGVAVASCDARGHSCGWSERNVLSALHSLSTAPAIALPSFAMLACADAVARAALRLCRRSPIAALFHATPATINAITAPPTISIQRRSVSGAGASE